MRRTTTAISLGALVSIAGCGHDAAPKGASRAPSIVRRAGPFHLVGRPLATVQGTTVVLRYRIAPRPPFGDTGSVRIHVLVGGAGPEEPDARVGPRDRYCFASAIALRTRPGARLPVSLRIGTPAQKRVLRDVVTVVRGDHAVRRGIGRMGCVTPKHQPSPNALVPKGAPPGSCRAIVDGPHQALPAVEIVSARHLSCRAAKGVMRRVAPALGVDYLDRLGQTHDRPLAGFLCTGKLIGDASWTITCRRGAGRFVALTAE